MKRLYIWYDKDFNQQKVIASSNHDARRQLLLQGESVIRIKPSLRITKKTFNLAELLIITKQLETLLKAGLPIVESLTLLSDKHHNPIWQFLLFDIKKQLLNGESLSKVLANYRAIFSPLYCEIIATGELTGQLENSFSQLVVQLEESIQLQKRIKKALRYPLFLLFVSLIVTLIMLLFVLPKFSEIYASFDAELPFFTQQIIRLSDFLLQKGFILLSLMIGLIAFYHRYFKPKFQKQITSLHMAMPIVGNIVRTCCLTQLFQTLSITQKAGIPLLSGLEAAAKSLNNSVYKERIVEIMRSIEEGHPFSFALNHNSFFPPLCFQLIHAGEESGSLDHMLEKLANYYQVENEESINQLTEKIEPLLMIILAAIVGTLVIAIYLPIFQLGTVIQ